MGKRWKICVICLLGTLAGNGCASMNNTERGAVTGGAIGAVLGALVGHDHGRTGTGAAIGGLIGTGVGAAVGHSEDKAERQARAEATAPVRGPLGMQEIVDMSRAGTSPSLIINQIRTTGTRYNLSGESIIWLQQNNVNEQVIQEMQNSGRYARPVLVREAPIIYERPYYCAPPPPVGIGFSYMRVR